MIELLDIVILKTDDPKTGIKAGTEGTIVDILIRYNKLRKLKTAQKKT